MVCGRRVRRRWRKRGVQVRRALGRGTRKGRRWRERARGALAAALALRAERRRDAQRRHRFSDKRRCAHCSTRHVAQREGSHPRGHVSSARDVAPPAAKRARIGDGAQPLGSVTLFRHGGNFRFCFMFENQNFNFRAPPARTRPRVASPSLPLCAAVLRLPRFALPLYYRYARALGPLNTPRPPRAHARLHSRRAAASGRAVLSPPSPSPTSTSLPSRQ